MEPDPGSLRMLCCVRRGLLRDAIEIGFEFCRQVFRAVGQCDFKTGLSAATAIPPRDQTFQARGQPQFIDIRRAQPQQRTPQGLHHLRSRSRDAVAFGQKSGMILRGGLLRRCSQCANGSERLPELVVKLASQVPTLVVLQGNQPAR